MISLIKNLDKVQKTILIFTLILSLNSLFHYYPNFFWDLNVYSQAVEFYLKDISPYREITELRFVYSPYVLIVLSFFGEYFYLWMISIYILILVISLNNKYTQELLLYSLISAPIFYNDFLIKSFAGGNLTIFLHLLVIAASSQLVNRKFFLFGIIVLTVSIIKPYFLAYLGLGVFLYPSFKKLFMHSSAIIISWALIFYSQFYFFNELSNDFLASLNSQIIGSDEGSGKDIGISIYSILANFTERGKALIFHFLSIIAIAYISFYKLQSIFFSLTKENKVKFLFFFSLILVTLSNPRMKVYDYWIVSGASTGLIFILLREIPNLYGKSKIYIFTGAIFYTIYMFSKANMHSVSAYRVYVILLILLLLIFYSKKLILRKSESKLAKE